MPAQLTASRDVSDELFESLLNLLGACDDDCVNWRPPAPDTNSIAALVHHTVGATETWLARALAEPVQRDRDAEFRAHGTADDLVELVERSRQAVRAQFDRLAAVDPGTVRQVRRLDCSDERPVTAAWCVEHAIIHAGEHWGQIQLTRHLYASALDKPEVPGTDIFGDETNVHSLGDVPGIAGADLPAGGSDDVTR